MLRGLIAIAATLAAATAGAAVVDVAVSDSGGRPAGGREVVLHNAATGFDSASVTNASGRARFAGVPPAPGYAVTIDGVALASGIRLHSNEARAVTVTLPEAITVTAKRPRVAGAINTLDAEVSGSLHYRELQSLPVEARDLSKALIRLPNVVPSTGFFPEAPPVSINGANGLFTQYLLDGLDNNENFLGGPKFPVSTGFASDITVLASSYSVEYGRTGNGIVNVTSPSGSNDWFGEVFYLVRPGPPVDASSPYPGRDLSGNAVRDGFRRDQVGVSLGGPIARNRTFFYSNIEYTQDEKDNRLASPAMGIAGVVPGENESLLGSLKLDHHLNDRWRLSARVNHGDVTIERQGGGLDGGVIFPSAGSVQERRSTLTGFSAVYDGDRFTSETRLGWSRFVWDYAEPLGEGGPQVTVESPDGLTAAILGHPGFTFDEQEDSLELLQRLSWQRDVHALKLGVDAIHSDFSLAGGGNPAGNYRVRLTEAELAQVRSIERGIELGIEDIPETAEVIDYAVELRPARFGADQDQIGVYFEDQVAL
ncbi:MAG TPA: TonB-dependent receptor, partial [Woeseiaceae bacterium]|nr:TonB-dependent receptor [Woeseiaceae bacterium]